MRSGRVVITGLGLVSPIGQDKESFLTSLLARKSGVRRIRTFDPSELYSKIGGEIEGFDPRNYLDKKDRKRLNQMVRGFQYAVAASQLALNDAQIVRDKVDPAKFGVILGSGTIPGDIGELGPAALASVELEKRQVDLRRWGEKGLEVIPPMWMLNHIPNMVSSHVSIVQNAQGPCNTITQTNAGGLLALGEALRFLRAGRGNMYLIGGADMRINPVTMSRYFRFCKLSTRNDEPEKACRPFDKQRDGKVLGEGAGLLLMESLEHAQDRGAPIYAEITGFGSTFDAQRDGAGVARALNFALQQAGITAADVDHVNANAVGDPQGDIWEAQGIASVFGDRTPVIALKGYFGDIGPGAAVLELAGSLLGWQKGMLPATLNHEETEPRCPIRVSREEAPPRKEHLIKLACTELGQVAAVVVKPWRAG